MVERWLLDYENENISNSVDTLHHAWPSVRRPFKVYRTLLLSDLHVRYAGIINECRGRGIVKKSTNLYDEHFASPATRDARGVPYLEGDFWVTQAEEFLKVSRISFYRINGSKGGKRRRIETSLRDPLPHFVSQRRSFTWWK